MSELYSLYEICFDYCKNYRPVLNVSEKEERTTYKNDAQYRRKLFLKTIDAMDLREFYDDYCTVHEDKFSEEWKIAIHYLLHAIDTEQDSRNHKDYFAVLEDKSPEKLVGCGSFYEKFMIKMYGVIKATKNPEYYMEKFSNSNFIVKHTEYVVRKNTQKTLQGLLDKLSTDSEFNNEQKIDNFTYIENKILDILYTIYPEGLKHD